MKERKLPISRLLDAGTPPEVLRAHTIADTLRALLRHGAMDHLESAARNAVAVELGVPALWLDAAVGEGVTVPRVDLDLLHEWREWEATVLCPAATAGGRKGGK